MYLGKHDMMYWPYLCKASPFSTYLSAGLTIGALSLPGVSRGANLKFGVSELPATSFARRTVVVKARGAKALELAAQRVAVANGRLTDRRRAMGGGEMADKGEAKGKEAADKAASKGHDMANKGEDKAHEGANKAGQKANAH